MRQICTLCLVCIVQEAALELVAQGELRSTLQYCFHALKMHVLLGFLMEWGNWL